MRRLVDAQRLRDFLDSIGRTARHETAIYLTGGSTAVLKGWRKSTVDVDIRFEPESDEIFEAIPKLKEKLEINVELASPLDFIPALPEWKDRSEFVMQAGQARVYHFDYYAQALAKLERGHQQDEKDVQQMLAQGLVRKRELRAFFDAIEAGLSRFPAIDVKTFRASVEKFTID